ncbi:hypothetical protein [Rosenbergiella epipactidis]|uniref:hypothetical protein n=1 Tax=Rosenbergiella epipactidis TaxID=1544694 RepID=UPI001F4DA22D|nr:hypothetical protein [Rosenbergiella epipactidis]
MTTKSFRFSTLGYLALEGVGSLHASYTLLLNVTESEGKEGKKLYFSASMLCNAAKAYGSGVIKPWCTVENNIDNKKYVLDSKDSAFALTQNEILIGGTHFTLKASKNIQPVLKIKTGYF